MQINKKQHILTLPSKPRVTQNSVQSVTIQIKEVRNFQQQRAPVAFKDGQLTPSKRNASHMDFSVRKKTKLQPTVVDFDFDGSFDSKLAPLSSIASFIPFRQLDVKVKVVSKTEEKQKIIVRDHPCFKTNCMIFDGTDSIKIELWESAIDKVARGKCYYIQNIKVKIFNDTKYLCTNEYTVIEEIESDTIPDLNLSSESFQDCIIEGKVIGIDINRTPSCPLCNARNDQLPDDEMIDCRGCESTFLVDQIKTKIVSRLSLQVDQTIIIYSAFNNALQSFLVLQDVTTKLADMTDKEHLLKASQVKLLVDQSTKVISQFL